jgi:hypothetical protein
MLINKINDKMGYINVGNKPIVCVGWCDNSIFRLIKNITYFDSICLFSRLTFYDKPMRYKY